MKIHTNTKIALALLFLIMLGNNAKVDAQNIQNTAPKLLEKNETQTSTKKTVAVEEFPFTGFWLMQCGTDFVQMGTGPVSRNTIKLKGKREFESVDMAAFKRQVKYKPSGCNIDGKGVREYFLVQLKKGGRIWDNKSKTPRPNSVCWTLSTVQECLQNCNLVNTSNDSGRIQGLNICSCSKNSKVFTCNQNNCEALYWLPN